MHSCGDYGDRLCSRSFSQHSDIRDLDLGPGSRSSLTCITYQVKTFIIDRYKFVSHTTFKCQRRRTRLNFKCLSRKNLDGLLSWVSEFTISRLIRPTCILAEERDFEIGTYLVLVGYLYLSSTRVLLLFQSTCTCTLTRTCDLSTCTCTCTWGSGTCCHMASTVCVFEYSNSMYCVWVKLSILLHFLYFHALISW